MSTLKHKKTFVLVIPRFEDIFHSFYAGEIIRGVSLSASRLNIDILIHLCDRSDHRSWLDSALTGEKHIDGVIFADIDNDLGVLRRAISRGIPCMTLNNILKEPVNYIAMDNRKAAIEVVDELVKMGHTRIATIAGDARTQAGLMRLEGFKEALDKNKIRVPRAYITTGDFLRTPARRCAQKLLKLKERPTAIFVASDVMALEAIDVARSLKIRVPQDLSIIGFDDDPICATSKVALSTVAQPLVEMGRLGLERLNEITQGKARLPVKMVLPTKLIKRKSMSKI